jgi:hypothetical protein
VELHPDLFTLVDPDDLVEDEFLAKVPSRYRGFVDEDAKAEKHHRPWIPGWD